MTDKRKLIAFMGGMIDEEKNCFFLGEMEKECRRNGYLMLVFAFSETTFWDQDRNNCEIKLIEMASHLDFKAIIMHLEFIKSDYLIEAFIELGRKKGIPVIAMERFTPGCINISMDYKNGFADMVRHVIESHGCRKVNMMAGIKGDHFSEDRIDAYKEVLKEKGLAFDESMIGYGEFWDRPARAATRKFLESGDIPDAIVCANDNMAVAVCDELEKSGFEVPGDIIVTGFDGVKKCLYKKPSISTVAPDYASEAAKVMELIISNEGRPAVTADESVNFILKLRESCGCKRSEDTLSKEDIRDLSDSYEDVNWAVTNVNSLFARASLLESICELSQVIQDTLWLWERDFQFVGLYTDLLRPEISDIGTKEFTTFFRYKSDSRSGIGKSYDEDIFIPDFDGILKDDDICVLIIKLLHAGNHIFGYFVEGTDNTTARVVRRCEEFGMFLSTAVNTVLANRDLANMRNEIEKISVLDYLTGIFNRRGFFGELEHRISQPFNKGRYLTVFSIDMDGLKYINDCYGHAQGDFAIQCVAGAIHHIVNRNGICARYGGDEFACALITNDPVNITPDIFRSRMNNVLLSRGDVVEKEYSITASVGSASALIDDSLNIEKLLREADEEMYADKKNRAKRKS